MRDGRELAKGTGPVGGLQAAVGAELAWLTDISKIARYQWPVVEQTVSVLAPTSTSQQAGKGVLGRLFTTRTEDRDANTNVATVVAQFEAARVWSMLDHSALERFRHWECPCSPRTATTIR